MQVTELEIVLSIIVTFIAGVAFGQYLKITLRFERPSKQ